MDITKEWIKKTKKGLVVEKLSYVVDGVTYTVDGKYVVLEPSELERKIAVSLSEKYGKDVELIPKVNFRYCSDPANHSADWLGANT